MLHAAATDRVHGAASVLREGGREGGCERVCEAAGTCTASHAHSVSCDQEGVDTCSSEEGGTSALDTRSDMNPHFWSSSFSSASRRLSPNAYASTVAIASSVSPPHPSPPASLPPSSSSSVPHSRPPSFILLLHSVSSSAPRNSIFGRLSSSS